MRLYTKISVVLTLLLMQVLALLTIHNSPPLYRTNDGRIVAEGDTDAAFLVVGTGGTIPPEYAGDVRAYGQADGAEGDSSRTETEKPARATKRSAGPSEDK